ncbi:NADP-dependent 3-hydroxy acid dehydrogenase YdfG [Loktanella salsilacus]|jgi:NAD(P)-dependent dehydrogenase (short-subunit alcohol dehydrogenase family)|uniref:NADP-dependent 3-hydroxy acid dehydrogenase YdfG n=1 Tax=Loktanella salsilacus TaxID=195913 RepID=A0A1I4IGA8_9RHOB|nr:SDR family NAD(P)-dependent oxidoreductase [Loktanella salsilacus]SFL52816.1 NADP-dependent 3-hydroxy acid dehydrogenase YdfG [Loktanella salsilacus]
MNISQQAAIVAGGASGLGAATARAMAAAGAKVAIFDRNAEAGQAIAQQIGGTFCQTDVTDPASVAQAIIDAAAAHGPARIVVNCAGIAPPAKVVNRDGDALPLADFMATVNVNLAGSFNVMAQAAAAMQRLDPLGPQNEERGVIINTASVAAYDGQIGQAAYAASKGGIAAMTLPVAREMARFGIRVMTIAPGLFLTPLMESLPADAQESLGRQVPFPPRLGDPADYAKLVLSIVDNIMLNGEVIRLDGAIRMAPK